MVAGAGPTTGYFDMTNEQRKQFIEMFQREKAELFGFLKQALDLRKRVEVVDENDHVALDGLVKEAADLWRRFQSEMDYADYMKNHIQGEVNESSDS